MYFCLVKLVDGQNQTLHFCTFCPFFFAVLAFLAKRFSLHGPMTETDCKKC